MNLLIFIGLIVVIVYLQIWLSKKPNKWWGLILPIVSFSLSVIISFSIVTFNSAVTGELTLTNCEINMSTQEEVCTTEVSSTHNVSNQEIKAPNFKPLILIFVLYNIPTIGYLIIYRICRQKLKETSEVDKVAVQAL